LLSSVAVQTLVITELFPVPATVVSAEVIVTLVSQLSLAAAVPSAVVVVAASHSTVTLAGEVVNVGAVLSRTVMVCVYVVALPLSSVAVQTLVITESLPSPSTVVSAEVIVTLVSQLSLAAAVPSAVVVVAASHSTVTLAGDVVNVGAVLSSNVMVWVYVLALPLSSVAVQTLVITELFPVPATVVSAEVIVTLVSQLSLAAAVPNAAVVVVASHSTVTLAGDVVNVGAVLSSNVMVWVYVFALPLSSVAVQTLVITELFPVPSAVVSAYVIATLVSQLSLAAAVPVAEGSELALHSTVTLAGDVVNVGTVESTTVII
jgi:hypothetical protein